MKLNDFFSISFSLAFTSPTIKKKKNGSIKSYDNKMEEYRFLCLLKKIILKFSSALQILLHKKCLLIAH